MFGRVPLPQRDKRQHRPVIWVELVELGIRNTARRQGGVAYPDLEYVTVVGGVAPALPHFPNVQDVRWRVQLIARRSARLLNDGRILLARLLAGDQTSCCAALPLLLVAAIMDRRRPGLAGC